MADRVAITPHFHLDEFDQPARRGVPAAPYPADWIASRLRPLCELLEELRTAVGRPVTILCGYRSPQYNAALAAAGHEVALHSQHMEGRAADIEVAGVPALALHAAVLEMYSRGQLGALGGLGLYPDFVHVDVRPVPLGHSLARWSGGRSARALSA